MSDEFDLNALIDKALTGKEPDPHVIARRLVPKIPSEQRDALAAIGLTERVKLRLRMHRSEHLAGELSTERAESTSSATARPQGRSKWERYDRFPTAEGWKLRNDLSDEDCDWIAERYEERASANAAIAAEFRALAERIRKAGVKCVGDLDSPEELAA